MRTDSLCTRFKVRRFVEALALSWLASVYMPLAALEAEEIAQAKEKSLAIEPRTS